MIALLNRISWGLSLIIGLLIMSFFGFGEISIMSGIFIGIIIKGLFFSRVYIEKRVENFAAVVLQRQKSQNSAIPNIQYQTIQESDGKQVLPNEKEIIHSDHVLKNDIEEDVGITDTSGNMSLSGSSEEKDFQETHENIAGEKTWLWIKNFFSEDILAKIGGIFVFLGVIFLLSLVWENIPGIGKVGLGFCIGMTTYITGIIFDKKGIVNESRILMGVGILINYAVILAGRYIIGENSADMTPLFSTEISFVFLIINTLFAIFTSMHYKSEVLLIFSFLFAYVNPLLIGYNDTTPYMNVGYAFIVSLGALFLAHKKSDLILLLGAFLFGNIFILISPVLSGNIEIGYMTKYIASIFLNLIIVFSALKMPPEKKNIVEFIIGGSFFFVATFGVFGNNPELSMMSFLITMLASFVFMGVSYAFMNKWNYLYAIGSMGPAIILGSHIIWDNTLLTNYYIIAIILYASFHFFGSMFLQIQTDTSLKNLILGSLSSAIFLAFIVLSYAFSFDKSLEFSGVIYAILAFIYGCVTFVLYKKEVGKNNEISNNSRLACYNFLAISISFLSIAVALIFSDYTYVTSLFWLLESAIIFFFYNKLGDNKIAFAGLILMGLGVLQWYSNIGNVLNIYEYIFPAFLGFLILASNTLQFETLNQEKNKQDIRSLHDIVHMTGLVAILIGIIYGISESFSPTKVSANMIFIVLSVLSIPLAYFYKKYGSHMQKSGYVILYFIALVFHIIGFIQYGHTAGITLYTGLFQYIITSLFILGGITFIYPPIENQKYKALIITTIVSYLFIISSFYIYNIFPNTFTLTIYWSIIAFFLISRGIRKDMISLRTLGLYLLAIVCLKVFLIDITTGISNPIIKVGAFIGVGILFIIIGTMYSKQYGNKLKGEFDLGNIFGMSGDIGEGKNSEK